MSLITSSQIGYGQAGLENVSYKFVQVPPQNFGANISLNASQQPVTFNLPVDVWNFSESYLSFTINLALVANQYIWTREDVWSGAISHIQFYCDSTSTPIVDLDNLQNYCQIVLKKETALNDLQTMDAQSGFYPSNSLKNAVPALQPNQVTGATPNPSFKSYNEPAYYNVQPIATAAAINVMLPLRLLKNTLFSMNKDITSPKITYLKLFFGPLGKFAFSSTSNVSPTAAVPAALPNVAGNYISNLMFYMASEANPAARAKVEGDMRKGLSFYVPWVQSFKNQNTGVVQNININLDQNFGATLSKMYHSVYNNTESEGTAYDNCNFTDNAGVISAGKVQTFVTAINQKDLQQLVMDCTATTGLYTDYVTIKNQLKGSVIQSRPQYQQQWFWCDDFSNIGPKNEQEDNDSIISGLPMTATAATWTFKGKTMNAVGNPTYQHYSYGIFMRRLVMNNSTIAIA
jgi:hypothetical protein